MSAGMETFTGRKARYRPGEWQSTIADYLRDNGPVVDDRGGATGKLAEAVGYRSAQTGFTKFLRQLEDDGVVEREITGRRCTRISLTSEAGCQFCERNGRDGCAIHRQPKPLAAVPEPVDDGGGEVGGRPDVEAAVTAPTSPPPATPLPAMSHPPEPPTTIGSTRRGPTPRAVGLQLDGEALRWVLGQAAAEHDRVLELEAQVVALVDERARHLALIDNLRHQRDRLMGKPS